MIVGFRLIAPLPLFSFMALLDPPLGIMWINRNTTFEKKGTTGKGADPQQAVACLYEYSTVFALSIFHTSQ